MKFVKVKTSHGSLGKNKPTELAPDLIIDSTEEIVFNNNIEEINKQLEESGGDFFIGGDHSITYPLFKSFAKKYKNPGLIIFDAHPDCTDDFEPPTHEDFVRVLINKGILKPENLLLIGVQKVVLKEKEFLEKNNIKILEKPTIEQINKFLKPFDGFYLSIDIDVLDKKYAPGTGYPDGKLELDYLLDILKQLKPNKIDLVESTPEDIESARKVYKNLSIK
ncbi:MAG: arginase family protein [archaeon]